jgi:hypothetical protein
LQLSERTTPAQLSSACALLGRAAKVAVKKIITSAARKDRFMANTPHYESVAFDCTATLQFQMSSG